jgi:hypothetical protein
MIAMDGVRCVALVSVPIAYAAGWLRLGQLVVVAVIVGAADICFRAASGSCLKSIVATDRLLVANARLESTTWTATMAGPPIGGALIGAFGPVVTVIADAVSYLLSALGIAAMPGREPAPAIVLSGRRRRGEMVEGWHYILAHRSLRRLLANAVLFNGLLMATAPLIAVLMLARLGVAPWQYGLAFAAPCVGGLAGSRLARWLSGRHGAHTLLRTTGTLRACWPVALAFIPHGAAGVAYVAAVEFGLITTCAVFNPVFATYRLEQTPNDRVAKVLAAWNITSKTSIALLTAAWGVLASAVGLRWAIGLAGALLLVTPLLLPKRQVIDVAEEEPEALAVA